jgi:hypothetical protein
MGMSFLFQKAAAEFPQVFFDPQTANNLVAARASRAAAGLTSPATFPLKTEPKEKMAQAQHE